MVFGIAACNNDENAPVINGAEQISVQAGTTFDQLQGVTALDSSGADLTSSIEVTGTFNINIAAVYTLVYKVSDSEGNETSVQRQVTVTAVDLEVDIILETISFDKITLHVLINFDFGNLDALANVVQTIATETYLDHFDHIDGNRYTLTIYAYQTQADYDSLDATYGYQVFNINSIGNPGLSSATNALKLS
jgi:hypothetical protein